MEDNKELQHKEYNEADKKSLVFKVEPSEHFTMKNTLATFKYAKDNAQSVLYPNRHQLIELYFDIKDDSHLDSVVKHRKTRITGLDFELIKTNGTIDEKTTLLFEQLWFSRFLDYTLDAMFVGNSLIQVNKNKNKITVDLVPRVNVIPEYRMLKRSPYSLTGDIDYKAPIFSRRLVDVNNNFDNRNLGEFLSVTELVLFKNEVKLNWAQYIELFGQPIRTATTDSQDPVEWNRILGYLKDLGRSGYLVKDSSTEITFEESSNNSSSSDMYQEFEKFCNEEISKKIIGGTMITDSGSSRSQSEVHERGSYLYTKADMAFVENVINNQLFPVLRNYGMISAKGIEFRFSVPEILTVEEKKDISESKIKEDEFIINNWNAVEQNKEYFEERYTIDLSAFNITTEDIKEVEETPIDGEQE